MKVNFFYMHKKTAVIMDVDMDSVPRVGDFVSMSNLDVIVFRGRVVEVNWLGTSIGTSYSMWVNVVVEFAPHMEEDYS